MSDSHVNIGPIECRLSCLTVASGNSPKPFAAVSDTILQGDVPFSMQVTVEFSGSGAIALLPLVPSIQVEFYAKPLSPESGLALGNIALQTKPEVFTYHPALNLGSPLSIGLQAGTIYRIGSVLRVGAPNWPSLINGFTEELTLEIYLPPSTAQATQESQAL